MNASIQYPPRVRAAVAKGAVGALLGATALLFSAPGLRAQDSVPPPPAFEWDAADPRIDLAVGATDAGEAIWNLAHVANLPRPEGFFEPGNLDDGDFDNTDLAFSGDYLIQGSYHGFQVIDVSNPARPTLEVAVVCPGGQGDVSVYRHLLFMSVQETRGRLDCGTQGVQDTVSVERARGVRVFDISDIRSPRQVAMVQTCRGSHTHTLVSDPDDDENVYVYVQGTNSPRPEEEMPGCIADPDDPRTALFRIEVIRVPLDAPDDARIVSEPRIFADAETGDIRGLWQEGDHGPGTQTTSTTDRCHDITAYPEIGLAAGACSGNGILLDISDPVNPVRIDEVTDEHFAYWHSATFNNDGTKVLFTDEWGGGSDPHCRATDPPRWGADAIFTLEDGQLELQGYYKLPVPQSEAENCVAHNGSLIPVPGRDIMAQAWYQGGVSVFDFTDPANPVEIAFFDRGPYNAEGGITGGFWSTYWHNGHIYGAEMKRGIDVFRLTPSEHLSQHEIDAAALVRADQFNAQLQPRASWPASVTVSHAYLDQLERGGDVSAVRATAVREALYEAEAADDASLDEALSELEALAPELRREAQDAPPVAARRLRLLAGSLSELVSSLR